MEEERIKNEIANGHTGKALELAIPYFERVNRSYVPHIYSLLNEFRSIEINRLIGVNDRNDNRQTARITADLMKILEYKYDSLDYPSTKRHGTISEWLEEMFGIKLKLVIGLLGLGLVLLLFGVSLTVVISLIALVLLCVFIIDLILD